MILKALAYANASDLAGLRTRYHGGISQTQFQFWFIFPFFPATQLFEKIYEDNFKGIMAKFAWCVFLFFLRANDNQYHPPK